MNSYIFKVAVQGKHFDGRLKDFFPWVGGTPEGLEIIKTFATDCGSVAALHCVGLIEKAQERGSP